MKRRKGTETAIRMGMGLLACVVGVIGWNLVIPARGGDLDEPVPRFRLRDAATLMAEVRSSLPGVPMQIQARITTRERDGRESRTVLADVLLHTDAGTYTGTYTVTDAFGTSHEQLIVTREPDREPQYRYRAGDPPTDARVPDLYERIKETDLTWIDLSLSFLWWPDGQTIGAERIRGRRCYVVEIPAPDDGTSDLAAVRLWIDAEHPMLMKAEAYSAAGERVRSLTVESFKKVDGVWFVKDMNVYSYPSNDRTNLRVDTLNVLEQSEADALTAPTVE